MTSLNLKLVIVSNFLISKDGHVINMVVFLIKIFKILNQDNPLKDNDKLN